MNDDDSSPTSTDTAPDAARRLPPWKEGLAAVGPTAAVGVLAPTVAIALGGSGWERPTAHTMALVHALLALLGGASVLDGARRCEGRAQLAWRIAGSGMLLYGLSNVAWWVAAVLGHNPVGGPAWIPAFIVANLLLVVGASVLPSSRRRISRTRRLDVAIMVVGVTCILWALPLAALVQRAAADRHDTAVFATLAVVKVASVLVAMGVLARCRPDEHHEMRPFAISLILLGVADLIFASVDNSSYPMFSRVADTLYNSGAVLWVLVGRRLTRPPVAVDPAPPRRRWLAPPETVTVVALVALAVHSQFDSSSAIVPVTLGAVMVLLAIIRLGQLEQEQRRLVSSLRASARRLHDQARVDALTGLGNRLALDERLQAICDRNGGHTADHGDRACDVAVLFIDVDHFKRFNDGLGHHVGDRVLVQMASRLREVLGDGVHRVGGDEFVAVVEGVDPADAGLLAQNVVSVARAPFAVDGQELSCTVSVGLAHLGADEVAVDGDGRGAPAGGDAGGGEPADLLLRRADLALYSAKERGRDQWAVYDPTLQHRADARLRLQQNLHEALAQGRIEVLYQPVVELATRRVVAASATPRWHAPGHGVLHPDSFLDALAEGGLLPEFDAYLLGHLARAARTARDSGLRWVAVAMSRPEIVHPGFTECLLGALRDAGADPALIRIAVTEETVIDTASRAVIEDLRRNGVQLIVHRFGTGPSSLLSLGDYPASTIVVDRSFVDGLGRRHDDTVIVNAVAGLTSDLGLELAADGVCDERQAQLLEEVGCTLAQGRLFGRPAPLRHGHLEIAGAAS